jgi:hypothetical protein
MTAMRVLSAVRLCHCSADGDTDGKDADEPREMGGMSSGVSSPTPEQAAGNAAQGDGRLDVTSGCRLRPIVRCDPGASPRPGRRRRRHRRLHRHDETFTESLEEFAQVYADQAEQDYGQLKQAISDGKIMIQEGI